MKMKAIFFAVPALIAVGAAYSEPTVEGHTISWPDDGWYQVQTAKTHIEICGGGRSCDVTPGFYNVINHSTGERFTNIEVVDETPPEPEGNTDTVVVTGNIISWPNDGWYQVQAAETYKQICAGTQSCEVEPGTYIVINHSTGQRFNDIKVVDDSTPLPPPTTNSIVVTDNVISWPNDGWYQVQAANTYKQICAGTRSCEVDDGTYIVINHTTNKRYTNIVVKGNEINQGKNPNPAPLAKPANLQASSNETQIKLTWNTVTGATSYNVYVSEQPTVAIGASGVTQYTSTNNAFTFTGAKAGKVYHFAATAEGNDVESDLSVEISAQLLETVTHNTPSMVSIPAGSFSMGCVSGRDNIGGGCHGVAEHPAHTVSVSAFKLSKTEVTFDQWTACVEGGGCNGQEPYDENWGSGSRPVINVNWHEAQAYVNWLASTTGQAYRLPSEAEWEYAARAGSDTDGFSWGNSLGKNQANCSDCGDGYEDTTAPVGSFPANAYGLYDMHGNVWEWVQDCWHENYTGAPSTGAVWNDASQTECNTHVVRGGSWDNNAWHSRSSNRYWSISTKNGSDLGFRVALDGAQ